MEFKGDAGCIEVVCQNYFSVSRYKLDLPDHVLNGLSEIVESNLFLCLFCKAESAAA